MLPTLRLTVSKLFLLLWCLVVVPWGSTVVAQTIWMPPSGERLRVLAERINLLVGGITTGFSVPGRPYNDFWALPDAEIHQQVIKSEFNLIAPEGQLKWRWLHPQHQVYNFEYADRHIQFATENNMKVVGHALTWWRDVPGWMANRSWTRDELLAVLYDHIDKVVGRYAGKIAVWDVVNEAFEPDGTYRKSLWYNTIGPDYITLAFIRARQADPTAKIIYNDHNGITAIGRMSDAVYNLLANLRRNSVPIDGIGFQLHLWLGGTDLQSFAANMNRFAALGLEIYITEATVRIQGTPTAQDLEQQSRMYRSAIRACINQPACKAFQMWGFTDKYSFVPQERPGWGAAHIFDENYRPKPAYFALQDELRKGR